MQAGPPRSQGLSLKGRALQLLAQREHSRFELRRKLLPLAALEEAAPGEAFDAALSPGRTTTSRRAQASSEAQARVDELLDWLQAHKYLSDARFAQARVHTRAARLGNLRIVQELAQHGVELAPDAAQALKDSEFARAHAVWSRKFGGPATDAAGRAKQMRFLAGRGFSPELIRRVVRGGDAEQTD